MLTAIGQRLDLAYAVAVHKWDNGVPVEAPLREREVLQQVQAAAHDYGLPPERAEAFFANQIEANKLVQYALIDRWTAMGKRPHCKPGTSPVSCARAWTGSRRRCCTSWEILTASR